VDKFEDSWAQLIDAVTEQLEDKGMSVGADGSGGSAKGGPSSGSK
jgi:hypothetical protein